MVTKNLRKIMAGKTLGTRPLEIPRNRHWELPSRDRL